MPIGRSTTVSEFLLPVWCLKVELHFSLIRCAVATSNDEAPAVPAALGLLDHIPRRVMRSVHDVRTAATVKRHLDLDISPVLDAEERGRRVEFNILNERNGTPKPPQGG